MASLLASPEDYDGLAARGKRRERRQLKARRRMPVHGVRLIRVYRQLLSEPSKRSTVPRRRRLDVA